MRIENPHGQFADVPGKDPVKDKRKSGSAARPGAAARPPDFTEELQAAVEGAEADGSVDWAVLVAELDRSGRELLERQDAKHLEAYKKSVKGFLTAAVRRTFRLKLVEGRGPNPKLYVQIERIEVKLDELARTVLAAHKSPLKLLAQVEELRGLLLDLKR